MAEYEYHDYVFEYKRIRVDFEDETWASAQALTWYGTQDKILPEIHEWRDKGWEPITEVGPGGVTIKVWTETFRAWSCGQWLMYFGMGITSLGLGFLVVPFFWRYRFFSPIEFRVRMRRLK